MTSNANTQSQLASSKSKYFQPSVKDKKVSQPAKRPNTEMADTSADELTHIANELKEIKEELGEVVKTKDMKEMIKSVVEEMMLKMKDEFNNKIYEMEKKQQENLTNLKDEMDKLMLDNETLRENLAKKQKSLASVEERLSKAESNAVDARKKANYNEQYSRKNNVKIHGIKELQNENTLATTQKMLREVAKVEVNESEVIAVHRIPGKEDHPRPIILKVKNTDIKARIMRKRTVVKKAGKRLSDDVTKLNSDLIQELNEHPGIEQAWYFNGNIYGKIVGGRRMKFDIHDNISEKIKKK